MTTEVTSFTDTRGRPATSARRIIDDLLQRVEDRLRALLSAEHDRYAQMDQRALDAIDALTDLVTSGGKRLRPTFCITGYLAAGGEAQGEGITAAAAGLEMLHVSALIHDDVLDDSAQRRGQPTIHTAYGHRHETRGWRGESRRFGEGMAILIGNLATVYSQELVSQAPPAVLGEWHRLCSEVNIGQCLDVCAAAEFSADPELSRLIALIKSGRYTIHRPLVMGAHVAGRPDLATAYTQYGEAVGEAFQLRDDLLDAFGDSAQTGKPTGLDVTQHKMTLLHGWAMQRDPHIRTLMTEPGHTPDEVRRRLQDTAVPEDVEKHIADLVEQGCAALAHAPIDPTWRRELADMAVRATYRTH